MLLQIKIMEDERWFVVELKKFIGETLKEIVAGVGKYRGNEKPDIDIAEAVVDFDLLVVPVEDRIMVTEKRKIRDDQGDGERSVEYNASRIKFSIPIGWVSGSSVESAGKRP